MWSLGHDALMIRYLDPLGVTKLTTKEGARRASAPSHVRTESLAFLMQHILLVGIPANCQDRPGVLEGYPTYPPIWVR